MLKVKITPPFFLAMALNPKVLAPELLAEVFADHGIQVVPDASLADLEICACPRIYAPPHWRLPKSRVILVESEPPHPEYLYEAYFQTGFAAVLTPVNAPIYGRDCLSFFPTPGEIAQQRQLRQGRQAGRTRRLIQLATYRTLGGTKENFMPVVINGNIRAASFVLSNLRCQVGLALKTAFPTRVDLYGEDWPPGVSKENSRMQENWAERKLELLSDYHFDLCWENLEIPYWVTEKIWMSVGLGLVPLYWGCDEMHRRLPRDSILDCRDFVSQAAFKGSGVSLNTQALAEAVFGMSDAEYQRRSQTLIDWFDSFPEDARHQSLLQGAGQIARSVLETAARL